MTGLWLIWEKLFNCERSQWWCYSIGCLKFIFTANFLASEMLYTLQDIPIMTTQHVPVIAKQPSSSLTGTSQIYYTTLPQCCCTAVQHKDFYFTCKLEVSAHPPSVPALLWRKHHGLVFLSVACQIAVLWRVCFIFHHLLAASEPVALKKAGSVWGNCSANTASL